jgi:hypothetical protein
LAENYTENVGTAGAQGHAQADLSSAAVHGVSKDIIDADNGQEQCKTAERR